MRYLTSLRSKVLPIWSISTERCFARRQLYRNVLMSIICALSVSSCAVKQLPDFQKKSIQTTDASLLFDQPFYNFWKFTIVVNDADKLVVGQSGAFSVPIKVGENKIEILCAEALDSPKLCSGGTQVFFQACVGCQLTARLSAFPLWDIRILKLDANELQVKKTPHSFGAVTNINGDKYVGAFRDGRFNGQGTWISAEETKYIGSFSDGFFDGNGTNTFANGTVYVGSFKKGKFNGQGTLTYAEGGKYTGTFKDGIRNGKGLLIYPEGNKYVGEFKNNLFDGTGFFYAKSGGAKSGDWFSGHLIKSRHIDISVFSGIKLDSDLMEAHAENRVQMDSQLKQIINERLLAVRKRPFGELCEKLLSAENEITEPFQRCVQGKTAKNELNLLLKTKSGNFCKNYLLKGAVSEEFKSCVDRENMLQVYIAQSHGASCNKKFKLRSQDFLDCYFTAEKKIEEKRIALSSDPIASGCVNMGFMFKSESYANCYLQLTIQKNEVLTHKEAQKNMEEQNNTLLRAQRENTDAIEQATRNANAAEKNRREAEGLRQLSQILGGVAAGRVGTPAAPSFSIPRPSIPRPQTIISPSGRTYNCTYVGAAMRCR